LCGIAPSQEWLVGARVLQAAAGAVLVATSLALVLPEFPAEKRATAVALWSATGAVAAALGPSQRVDWSRESVRSPSFAVANAGMFAFSTAFYALLLCHVLFLTQVWGYSILTAGFAVTAGPLTAALFAPVGGRVADRFGRRVVAVPGGLLFATAARCSLSSTRAPTTRASTSCPRCSRALGWD
jgi:NTE family protein